eukprot:TRINITY_DN7941_c0_g1_i1.p1 TRINITY_DN7941_c0_g1~~TRINITY_DN7941_c0_g1_i1.p1  ORF type:complete len:323 (-),score=102.66 TRINITY_DN7941_c0_g1_i1:310-1278(-)
MDAAQQAEAAATSKAAAEAEAAEQARLEAERIAQEEAQRLQDETAAKEAARAARVAEAERIIREQEELIKAEQRRKDAENAKPAVQAPKELIVPREDGRRLKKREASTDHTPTASPPLATPTGTKSAQAAAPSPTVGRQAPQQTSAFQKKQLSPKPAPPPPEPVAEPPKPTPKRWTVGGSSAPASKPRPVSQPPNFAQPQGQDKSYFSGPNYLGPISSLMSTTGPKSISPPPAKAPPAAPVVATTGMSVREKAAAFRLEAERQKQAEEGWKQHRTQRGSMRKMSPSGSSGDISPQTSPNQGRRPSNGGDAPAQTRNRAQTRA